MFIQLLDKPEQIGHDFILESNLDITQNSQSAEIVYTHFSRVDPKGYPNLKYVLCPCTGIQHLSNLIGYPDIEVFYLDNREYLFDFVWSTAEHTISLIHQACKLAWKELKGSHVGFVGFGRVAQQVARLLTGYDVTMSIYDIRYELFDQCIFDNHRYQPSLVPKMNDIFRNCDIITIHLPEVLEVQHMYSRKRYNTGTVNLINIDHFKLCQRRPIIINTSRSSIIQERALLSAYYLDLISAFGIDVMESYPNDVQQELRACGRGVVTGHIAGKSSKSREETDRYVFLKLKEAMNKCLN